ncbi:hypothetical protein ACFB49_17030 [Sphingomonas sp. DBB INV C78]
MSAAAGRAVLRGGGHQGHKRCTDQRERGSGGNRKLRGHFFHSRGNGRTGSTSTRDAAFKPGEPTITIGRIWEMMTGNTPRRSPTINGRANRPATGALANPWHSIAQAALAVLGIIIQ